MASPLVNEKKAKKGHQKCLVMKIFRKNLLYLYYVARAKYKLRIKFPADKELINHHLFEI